MTNFARLKALQGMRYTIHGCISVTPHKAVTYLRQRRRQQRAVVHIPELQREQRA